MVPIDTWENVLPMDIFPNALYRAILAEDFDEMEGLGLLECDEEDFALCTFSCPSKIDVGAVIREGLDMMEKEG
jgi:Na+-transporting NADH:ubiquinone oxidoreductase subunit A